MSELRVDIADLLAHPGARREVHLEAALADLGTSTVHVAADPPVQLDLLFERVSDGIVVRGRRLGGLASRVQPVPHRPRGADDPLGRRALRARTDRRRDLPARSPRARPRTARPRRGAPRAPARPALRAPTGPASAPISRQQTMLPITHRPTPVGPRSPSSSCRRTDPTHRSAANGCSQAQDPSSEDPATPRLELAAHGSAALAVPQLRVDEVAPHGVRQLRLVPRAPSRRGRLARDDDSL